MGKLLLKRAGRPASGYAQAAKETATELIGTVSGHARLSDAPSAVRAARWLSSGNRWWPTSASRCRRQRELWYAICISTGSKYLQ